MYSTSQASSKIIDNQFHASTATNFHTSLSTILNIPWQFFSFPSVAFVALRDVNKALQNMPVVCVWKTSSHSTRMRSLIKLLLFFPFVQCLASMSISLSRTIQKLQVLYFFIFFLSRLSLAKNLWSLVLKTLSEKIYEFPFDWSERTSCGWREEGEKSGKFSVAIMSWQGEFLRGKNIKAPLYMLQLSHCLWLWLIMYRKKHFFVLVRRRKSHHFEEDLFRLLFSFVKILSLPQRKNLLR